MGAIIVAERRRGNFGAVSGTAIRQYHHGLFPDDLGGIGLEVLPGQPLSLQIGDQALVEEQIRQRDTVFRFAHRALPQVEHQLLGALAREIAKIGGDLLHSGRGQRLRPDVADIIRHQLRGHRRRM